MFSTHVAFEYF